MAGLQPPTRFNYLLYPPSWRIFADLLGDLMRIETIVLSTVCVLSFTPAAAQATQSAPQKKGVFALMDKLSGNGAQAPSKAKVPPPPPALRSSGTRHSQRVFVSTYGRAYVLTNFKDIPAEKQAEYESALSAKNGFRTYQFGMTVDAFVAEAKKQGEKFKRSKDEMFSGKDFFHTTPIEKQVINGVSVELIYVFHKGALARITVKPHPSHPDLTAKELLSLYEAFASTYGPGEEKIIVSRDWSPTPFQGCDELVQEDALHKMMSTTLAEQRSRGGFRPDQIGENLTFTGYFWHSDKVEINFCTPTDLGELMKPKASAWEQNTGEKTFTLSMTSKTVLGPYLAEQVTTRSGSGSKGI